jgi:hypothetical protein
VTLAVAVRRVARFGVLRRLRNRWRVYRWEQAGRQGPPPPPVKLAILREYRERFGLDTMVETGTYLGDTVAALRDDFRSIITIELDHALAAAATRRFRDDPRVEVLQGDSGLLLPRVLGRLQGPALFWLDAHYSGGVTAGAEANPIVRELRSVLIHDIPGHVILIDDARLFDGTDGYPALGEVVTVVREFGGWDMTVADDIIRVYTQDGSQPAA